MFDSYVQKYKNKGLLIDTNLLLMLFVGSVSKDVSQFKRTEQYQASDYLLLLDFADQFKPIITTPNILTEVSNLAGSNNMHGKILASFFEKFTSKLTEIPEKYIQSKSINKKIICNYGLTDAGIIHLIKDKYLLLTDDFKLHGFASSKNIDAINFNHIRFPSNEI